MNFKDLAQLTDKDVFLKKVTKGVATSSLIQLKKDAILKDHQSRTDALLIMVSGKVTYEEETRQEHLVASWDYVLIPAQVTHRLVAEEESHLLLIQ